MGVKQAGLRHIVKACVFVALLMVVWIIPHPAVPKAVRTIKGITVQNNPETLHVKLSSGTAYRVFQIDRKEVVIALKNVAITGKLLKNLHRKGYIREIRLDTVPNRVMVLTVYTKYHIKAVNSKWSKKNRTLSVRFRFYETSKKGKHIKPAEKALFSDPAGKLPRMGLSHFKNQKLTPADSVDLLVVEMEKDTCITHPEISSAIRRCKSQSWQEAYNISNQYLQSKGDKECLEQVFFLRAYCFYKKMDPSMGDQRLAAKDLFQEVVSFYPKSRYAAYGIAALGKINLQLENYNEAKGYFKYILGNYKDYPAIPDIMIELARVQLAKGKVNLAVATLENLIARYPNNPSVSVAKLELGKALFESNDFEGALKIFVDLMESNPQLVFASSDLLEYMGRCYYQMGENTAARNTLLRAVNYFPDMASNHILLSRIADIYYDQDQQEKAQKFHEYVVKNFRGTDGFIISSVRMASYLKRRAEKENLYRLIISDFPDHPMTQLAYLKLAQLLSKVGEHEKSIETIHSFLAKFPGTLKKEAIVVLKDAYSFYFEKLFKENDTASLLTMFERDRSIINRIRSPQLFLTIGKAYMSEKLYEDAVQLFQQSHRLFGKKRTPAQLLFNLGISLHESGKAHQALKIFDAYTRSFPKHEHRAEVYHRVGRIWMQKKKHKQALETLKVAFKESRQNRQKATILLDLAEAYEKLGDYRSSTRRRIKAIDLMAAVPETPPDLISEAYRDLGESYLRINAYLKAADAFLMAIKFSGKTQPPDLQFLLGEAYERGEKVDEAAEIFKKLLESSDPFWARLAKEKLRGIQIHNQLKSKADNFT
ncbi:MAG: tetratricopeptide repeat protein [Deltaproteobacteria bacterium]|nr:tetratricopeptide repeat protein [Deltaproteobacteria bacterium]